MTRHSLKQSQTQTQIQTQTLSPQQVMVARLLELTAVELEDRVRSETIENPALEQIEPENGKIEEIGGNDEYTDNTANSADDYSNEDDIPDYNGWEYHSYSEKAEDIPVSAATSFGDTLLEQLGELPLDSKEQTIGEYLIGSLENDGLLHKPLSEIEDELAIYYGITTDEKEILQILKMIQTFDPAGIGARSLQECLLLQLERTETDTTTLSKKIISEFYEEFTKKHWDTLPDKLNVCEAEFREAINDITRLNPRPGTALSESIGFNNRQITPDFTIEINGEEINIQLNNMFIPELRVSNDYQNMLEEQLKSGSAEHKAAAQFIKQKIDAAKGFISAIKQREQTLLATMQGIVKIQKDFILSGGDEALLKPMILEDIAKITAYDISTISRVSNSKYVQLPWGIFPLKYFFSDGVVASDGSERSVRELHRCLRELINSEDKSNPLTDTELMEKLHEEGFTMARRTVAKYREHLHIPVARLRKE